MSDRQPSTPIDPPVLFVKPRAIKASDKKALAGAGIIVVEVDDPQSVKLVRAHSEISGSQIMMAALRAINNYDSSNQIKADFMAALMAMIDPTE